MSDLIGPHADEQYVNDEEFIKRINNAQSSWTAKSYPEFEKWGTKIHSLPILHSNHPRYRKFSLHRHVFIVFLHLSQGTPIERCSRDLEEKPLPYLILAQHLRRKRQELDCFLKASTGLMSMVWTTYLQSETRLHVDLATPLPPQVWLKPEFVSLPVISAKIFSALRLVGSIKKNWQKYHKMAINN